MSSPYRSRSVQDGALVLCSPLLEEAGLRHGFATRLGGVSEGVLASLNFGLKGGDRLENVRENLRRLAGSVGFDAERCYRLRQVHGSGVVRVDGKHSPHRLVARPGDALVSDVPGLTLGVVTADCVPVLLADPGRAAGAAHAGWRGLVAGVLEATVTALVRSFGARPDRLLAAIGPCIGPCCYEVGEDVAAKFEETAVRRPAGSRPRLDLARAARARLRAAGLLEEQIAESGLCTRCRPDLFYSFRRDGQQTGHHLSVIGIAG